MLSSHELALGYEEVTTNSIYLTFPLQEDSSRQLLVWTTTPWTLLSNVAVAVNPDLEYGEYRVGDRRLILATARAASGARTRCSGCACGFCADAFAGTRSPAGAFCATLASSVVSESMIMSFPEMRRAMTVS